MGTYGNYEKSSAYTRELKFLDSGNDVKKLQRFLMSQHYNVGKAGADGFLGKDTIAAWIKYEQEHAKDFMGDNKATVLELNLLATNPVKSVISQNSKAAPALRTYEAPETRPVVTARNTKQNVATTSMSGNHLNLTPAQLTALKGKVLVLDIGHKGFGDDHGSAGDVGIDEATLNEAEAMAIKAEVEPYGVKVVIVNDVMAQTDDYSESLDNRRKVGEELAMKYGPENVIFASIHQDYRGGRPGLVVHSMAGDKTSVDLAKNISSTTNGTATTRESAFAVLNPFRNMTQAQKAQANPPAYRKVLIECSDLSCEKRITQESYQQELARDITEGIINTWLPERVDQNQSGKVAAR